MKHSKLFASLLFMLSFCGAVSRAQHTTTLTGTITDSDSQTWNNATWTATIVVPGGGNPVYADTGQPAQRSYTGILSTGGVFSGVVGNNNAILPNGTYWNVCIAPLASTPAQCYTKAITGSSFNLGSSISSSLTIPAFRIQSSTLTFAYNTTELVGVMQGNGWVDTHVPGTQVINCWSGSAWTSCGGGGSSQVWPTGNGLVTINNTGSPAWGVTIPQVPIENFGAVGYTTSSAAIAGTDSTIAVQNCINALETGPTTGQCIGQSLYYKINGTITINTSGVGFGGVYTNTIGDSPKIATLITDGQQVILHVGGADSSHRTDANLLTNFQVARTVASNGSGSHGVELEHTNLAKVYNVTSDDSDSPFWFHDDVAPQVYNSYAEWNQFGVTQPNTGTFRGFDIDSEDGFPSNSFELKSDDSNGIYGSGATYIGLDSHGAALNDLWADKFESSNASYCARFTYDGSGSLGTASDIQFTEPNCDQASVAGFLVTNLPASGGASFNIDGGWVFSFSVNSIGVDSENSSGVSVNHVQIGGSAEGVKIGNTSTNYNISNNTFMHGSGTTGIFIQNGANYPGTVFPNQYDSTITTQVADNSTNGGYLTSPYFFTTQNLTGGAQCTNGGNCFSNLFGLKNWDYGVFSGGGQCPSGSFGFLDITDSSVRPICWDHQGIYSSVNIKSPGYIINGLSGTAPLCPNGTGGAFTTTGCITNTLPSGNVTFTDLSSGAITSLTCNSPTCTNTRGEIAIVVGAGGVTAASIFRVNFSTTLSAAPFCTVSLNSNGQSPATAFNPLGSVAPTTAHFDVSAPTSGYNSTNMFLDYTCQP